jgi:hypothetical protein
MAIYHKGRMEKRTFCNLMQQYPIWVLFLKWGTIRILLRHISNKHLDISIIFIYKVFLHTSTDAGWSSLVARRAHNPKVTGSNPVPATILHKLEKYWDK